jgi:hypothetical protein
MGADCTKLISFQATPANQRPKAGLLQSDSRRRQIPDVARFIDVVAERLDDPALNAR